MNVYDFDHTIYRGDSTIDFYFFCLRKHPQIIGCLPRQLMGAIQYKRKRITKTKFKEQFYCFLPIIKNLDLEAAAFWDIYEVRIENWYREQQEKEDCIISASPEFLLIEICHRIGIQHLIASVVDQKGRYHGKNCRGEEKLRRFRAEFPGEIIHKFYSDSRVDAPLAEAAEQAYYVMRGKISPWN